MKILTTLTLIGLLWLPGASAALEPESTPIENAYRFQRKVVTNLRLKGKRVMGEFHTHVSGDFAIKNLSGNSIKIRFIGTLHDWRNPTPGAFHVTRKEKAFINRNFPSLAANQAVFVEQGANTGTSGNLYRFFTDRGWTIRDRSLAGFKYDIFTEFEYVEKIHPENKNFDLRLNPEMPTYLLNTLKIPYTQVLNTMDLEIMGLKINRLERPGVNDAKDNSAEIQAWLEHLGLKTQPYDGFESGKKLRLTNGIRERFMADQVLQSSQDLVIVAHTAHITAIIGLLAPYLTDFHLRELQVGRKDGEIFETEESPEKRWLSNLHDPKSWIQKP
jgi:hypothetical protein